MQELGQDGISKDILQMTWDDLDFWDSGEWQVISERLDEFDHSGVKYNPTRENLFAALDAVDFDKVKVAVYGQDPYPDPRFCTGIAFSIPHSVSKSCIPASLVNIFREYCTDLHYKSPSNGDLTKWCRQGVLLWNVTPTCYTWQAGSHADWTEWTYLTKEITLKLSEKGIVFVLMGKRAQQFKEFIDEEKNTVIETSHPSPLGANRGRYPFIGSRVFSTVNSHLVEPIDWRLYHTPGKRE